MNRTTIIAVFLVFLSPVIIAVLMHSTWFDWRPAQTRNHGELVQPPHSLPEFELIDADGQAFLRDQLEQRWQLIRVERGPCEAACVEAMYWMRQVRRAQDRHQPDIGLVLLSTSPVAPEWREEIRAVSETIRVVDGIDAHNLLALLPDGEFEPVAYISDPQANIILSYPPDTDYNGMRRDLRRLLTWTRTD